MNTEIREHFIHMLDYEKRTAYDTRDITRVRECISFCEGIILTLIATDADYKLEAYAESIQKDMYKLWNELNNVRQF